MQRIISSIGAAAPEVDFDQVQPKIYELSLLCDVITSYQLARFLGHGADRQPTTRFRSRVAELDDIVVGDELDDETWNALASWTVRRDARRPRSPSRRPPRIAGHEPHRRNAGAPGETTVAGGRGPAQAEVGCGKPQALDQALLPLAAESVASDQPIEFVRVAGDVSTPASEAFDALCQESASPRSPVCSCTTSARSSIAIGEPTTGGGDASTASERCSMSCSMTRRCRPCETADIWRHMGYDDSDRTVDDIKHWLLETRQLSCSTSDCGKQPNFDAAIHSDEFIAWARSDRRLSSLLGTRTLTSTAIRGVITSSKMLRRRAEQGCQGGAHVFVRRCSAVAGVALAGRRAAAAVAWTVCAVWSGSRSNNHNDRWALWVVGLVLGMASLFWSRSRFGRRTPVRCSCGRTCMRRPGHRWCRWHARSTTRCREPIETPGPSVELVWMIPPVAAAASAAMLFFWMRWWAAALLTASTAVLYLHSAHAAYRGPDRTIRWTTGRGGGCFTRCGCAGSLRYSAFPCCLAS